MICVQVIEETMRRFRGISDGSISVYIGAIGHGQGVCTFAVMRSAGSSCHAKTKRTIKFDDASAGFIKGKPPNLPEPK